MEIKRCLILDSETTGLEDTAQVIEVGAILYSVENQISLQEVATLLPCETNEAEAINRIKVPALLEIAYTKTVSGATSLLRDMANAADCYIAHNAEFDQKQLAKTDLYLRSDIPWLCTKADFRFPLATSEQPSLINLALEHGIGVSSAHRALTDCRLIAALFDRMADLPAMFEVAVRPKGLFQAIVPFERKDEAKAAGFRWNSQDRTWTRQMAVEDAEALKFPVRRLDQAA